MENTFTYRLAKRLRPGIVQYEGSARIEAALEVTSTLSLLPFAIAAVVWLFAVFDAAPFQENAIPFALVVLGSLVSRNRSFTVPLRLGSDRQVNIVGSMTSVIHWTGLLAFGPVAGWLIFAHAVIDAALQVVSRFRRHQEALWNPSVLLVQGLSTSVLSALVAMGLYERLGGVFPFLGESLAQWGMALGVILIYAVLPSVTLLPLYLLLSDLTATKPAPRVAATFMLNLIALSVLLDPFSTLGALLFARGGLAPLAVFFLAVTLANLLAHYLSRASQRAQNRARELARLEELGEALLDAPPDGTRLEEILRSRVRPMFPGDLVEIRLDPARTGLDRLPAFRLTVHDQPPLAEEEWQGISGSSAGYEIVKDVVPPVVPRNLGDVMVVSIRHKEAENVELGYVAVFRPRASGSPLESLAATQSLASQISTCLSRARAYEEALALQRTRQELAVAGHIQATFLPREVPSLAGWDLASALVPARETSGDFYDFVDLSDGRLGIIVADVADKGTGAALYMALSRTLIRTYAMQHPDAPGLALRAANERILADTGSDQFVTVFYGVLTPGSSDFVYANAGHNPAFLLRRDGRNIEALKNTGIPLGMFDGMDWKDARVTLATGDLLVLYTDGVSEAQNTSGGEFGEERLRMEVASTLGQPAAVVQEALLEAVKTFAADAPQFDDITLLIAARTASPASA